MSRAAEWAKKARQKDLLGNGFWHFAQNSGMLPDITEQPHKEMCDELEAMEPRFTDRTQRKKLFLACRFSYKTSLLQCFCVYLILKYPDIKITIYRANRELAMGMLLEIKGAFRTNPVILSTWGDLSIGSERWAEASIVVNTRTKPDRDPTIMAVGSGVSTTGTHPDVVIADDMVVRENCDSPAEMETAWQTIQAMYPLLPPWGTIIVSGTIWSQLDCYTRIRQNNLKAKDAGKEPPYEEYVRAAYYTDANGVEQLFFPAKISEGFLEQQRDQLDPRWYASWYMNQPYEAGLKPFVKLQMFDADFEAAPVTHMRILDESIGKEIVPLTVAMTIDPAMTAEQSSDSFGICVIGFDADGNWWVLEALELRMLPSDATFQIVRLLLLYEPRLLIIEAQNADADMVSRIGGVIKENRLETQVESYFALTDEARGKRGKSQRIGALEPLVRSGQIYFRRGRCAPLIHQMDQYPGIMHDDVLDALAMGRKAAGMIKRPPKELAQYMEQELGDEKPDPWHEQVGWQQTVPDTYRGLPGTWCGPR